MAIERPAFVLATALLIAPVFAQGLWLPLQHVVGGAGLALHVTVASLFIATLVGLGLSLWPQRGLVVPATLAVAGALLASSVGQLGAAGLATLLIIAVALPPLMRHVANALPGAALEREGEREPRFLPPGGDEPPTTDERRGQIGPSHQVGPTLDGLARNHRLLALAWTALVLASIVSTARLSVFVGDSARSDLQVLPRVDFLGTHSCLSAYVKGSQLARQRVDNLYDESWWRGSEGQPPLPPGVENPYHPFILDYYAYPPPFLFVVAPLAPLDGDYPAQRALWFGMNGMLLALGLWIVARWMGGPNSHRVLLLAPIFFGNLPILATLQIGNFQIAVVVMSTLAMVAFDRDRPKLGGALLAFAIVSKLSPAILGVVLLAQRRWREAAWTAVFGLLLTVLSLVWLGPNPLVAFATYLLPRISSGQAFAFMDDRWVSILTNMSPFGLPFKLQLLGLDVGDPWRLAPWIGRAYSLLLVGIAAKFSRCRTDRQGQAVIWLSLLVLGAIQSPFAPGYVTIGVLWALTIRSVHVHRWRGGLALLAAWFLLTFVPEWPLRFFTVYSVLQGSLAVAVPIGLMVQVQRNRMEHSTSEPRLALR